jgi:regulator of sirC expression with transglutaminase-like and TPR domain
LIIDVLKARKAFAEIAAMDETIFALDRAALTLCLEDYPNLNIDEYLRRLDTLAARTEILIGQDRSVGNVLNCLQEILFVQEGLRGNTEDYYDPRNSLLNYVLDRKQGISISLSVIYIEVARRISFPVHGVGFPGHFLVKWQDAERELLIDPFNAGRTLTRGHCQELLDRVYGGSVSVQPSFLQTMGKKSIISRLLFNLKGIYYQKEEYPKALAVVERILQLNPGTPSEIRDRGLLYMQTSLFAKALADLEYYFANADSPQDTPNIESRIEILRSIVGSSN